MLPSDNGESWFEVVVISSSLFLLITSHAQPEPNFVIAEFENSSLKLSNDWKVLLIASARFPVGCLLLLGDRISQKNEWFAWPPPLLIIGVCLSWGSSLIDVETQEEILN